MQVTEVNGELKMKDQCTWEEEKQGLLKTVFENGKVMNEQSLSEIRNRINTALEKHSKVLNA
jgi:nicotinamide phosphoribosyltransferase